MSDHYIRNVVEAALLAAGRPLPLSELVGLFGVQEDPQEPLVREALEALALDYEGRGIELKEVASGWRVQIRSAVSEPVSKLWQERPAKYSRALLETLALVAYRQPITRGEIEQIRGVAVNPNIIKTLLERGWVRVVGHRDVPGKPELLGTTKDFLDYFGLKKLDDLPTLVQLKEMEELRVQLALPGAEPAVAEDSAAQSAEPEAFVEEISVNEAGAEEAAEEDESAEPPLEARPQGMVAAGPEHE